MNPIIEFQEATNAGLDSRQFVCNVWPLIDSDIGEAIFLNQPISAKGTPSKAPSRLNIKTAGNYLIELVHPSGRRTQRVLDLHESCVMSIVLPQSHGASTPSGLSSSHIKRRPARVLTSGTHNDAQNYTLEILAIPAPRTSAEDDGNLRAFLAGILACRRKGVKIGQVASDAVFAQFSPLRADKVGWFFSRVWLLARDKNEALTLVAYPDSWRSNEDDWGRIVASRTSTEAPWEVSLKLLDSAQVSLLEFLSNRDWESAWAIYSGMDNYAPDWGGCSTLISAYAIALAEEKRDHSTRLPFGTLLLLKAPHPPDLLILQAWLLLRGADVSSLEFGQAREIALTAARLGFPIFTIGLRVLCDALTYISSADPEDREIRHALGSVTRAVMVCQPGEIFTTIDVSRLLAFSRKDKTPGGHHA